MSEYIISDKQYAKLIFAAGNHDYDIMDDVAEELENNELVRCKDCKYFYDFDNRCSKFFYNNNAIFASAIVEPDGFCAWGADRGAD